jgi:hypothetical protein
MNTKDEIKSLVVLILFVATVLTIMIVPILFAYGIVGGILRRDSWKERTTPLPEKTVKDLCEYFVLDDKYSLCDGSRDVYGPDFDDVIREKLLPETDTPIFYDDVERMLGEFRTNCEPVAKAPEGWSYFRCSYDLRQDGQFPFMIMYYYPQNEVFEVFPPQTNDGI